MAKFSLTINQPGYQKLINNTLGDKETAKKFIADVSTVVSLNPTLQNCDIATVLSAGFTAQSLHLPLAPALSYCYIIPRNGKNGWVATFQISWRGLIQLALRTNQYQKIDSKVVHEGEWLGRDEYGEDLFKWDYEFEDKPVIGYYAYFKLTNGFVKQIYWTKSKCEKHARTYSDQYRLKGTGKWKDMFDEMALKTVLKQLLSKWGILSPELQTAIQADQAVVKENGTYEYVDNQGDEESDQKSEITIPTLPTKEEVDEIDYTDTEETL